jgi:hypothetical protein
MSEIWYICVLYKSTMKKLFWITLLALSFVMYSCQQKPCPGVGGTPKQSKKVQKALRKYPVKS